MNVSKNGHGTLNPIKIAGNIMTEHKIILILNSIAEFHVA